MMERYTAQLKELEQSGTIESAGSYDQLNRMFVPEKGSHQIGLLSRFAKDTGIKCGSDPIQPEVVLRYLESRRGIIFEDGVIFADVPENFFRYNSCSRLRDGSRWLISTMSDSICVWKENGTIWIKNTPTGHSTDSAYVKINLPRKILPDNYVGANTHLLHKALFYTFMRMTYSQVCNLSIDHVNGNMYDNCWVNI